MEQVLSISYKHFLIIKIKIIDHVLKKDTVYVVAKKIKFPSLIYINHSKVS